MERGYNRAERERYTPCDGIAKLEAE